MKKVLVVFGTRPEATKMAPVILRLREEGRVETRLAVTAQHRGLLDQALEVFGITPDHDLDIMRHAQSLTDIGVQCLMGLEPLYGEESPDLVVVHGDTSTTLYATLAAYNQKIPVAHVEAGLRSGDPYSPFPEEINRKLTDQVASLHLAPTETARANLLREGVSERSIFVTGNTAIDAILRVTGGPRDTSDDSPLLLVECHRRENFGEPHAGIFRAVRRLVEGGRIRAIVSSHPNPSVRVVLEEVLGRAPGVEIIDPPGYPEWAALMRRATLILTDSGGLQEEAPALHVPVILARTTTERPEGVAAGCVLRVDPAEAPIFEALSRLLSDQTLYHKMASSLNPFGDGRAADRIARCIYFSLGLEAEAPPEFRNGLGACQYEGHSV